MSKHDDDMLDTFELDATKARRGAVISSEGKTRITIYLDNDVLDHFRTVATAKGRGYQTEINNTLRGVIDAGRSAGRAKAVGEKRQVVLAKGQYHVMLENRVLATKVNAGKGVFSRLKSVDEITALVQGSHHRRREVA